MRDSCRADQSQSRAGQRQPIGFNSGRSQRAVTHLHYFGQAHSGSITDAASETLFSPYTEICTQIRTTMSDRKAVIKNADMSEEMQQDAVECATQALEKYNIEKDIAAYIKKEFDKKYNPTWHCIVGRNFGSYVTHETKHFIYFYLGQVAILLFKSG
ncbi:hypothetical protein R3I94_014890 [Phoxinus phoxinus]